MVFSKKKINIINFHSYSIKFFDQLISIDLKENGKNIAVTEANKKEYIELFCLAKMNKEIRAQAYTIRKGILEIIPADLLELLHENELGMVISGINKIEG